MAAFNFRYVPMFLLVITCVSVTITEGQAGTEYNRYLAHIFEKYGNGGTMSFEGLEHLMYNLGLGQLEFEPSHTVEEHKPKNHNVNVEAIKSYMDQQTKKLLSYDEDLPMSQDPKATKQQSTDKTGQHDHSHHDDNDESQKPSLDNTVIVEFKEMHDPKHRHPRENNDATFDGPPLPANVCLSPKSLLRLVIDHDDLHKRKQLYKTYSSSSEKVDVVNQDHDLEEEFNHFVNYVRLTPVTFMKLCPALLAQIDQQVCMQPAPLKHLEDSKDMIWNAWIYASASIFILSACGLLGILLVPLMKTVAYQEILNFLIAVAVGTLSGDALMHLLPHALVNEHAAAPTSSEDHEHDHGHGHGEESSHSHDTTAVWICACAFFTAVLMYIIENLLPLLRGGTDQGSHGHSHHHHHHSHSHNHTNNNNVKQVVAGNTTNPTTGGDNNAELPASDLKDVRELNIMLNEAKMDQKKPSRPLTPVAFMVIIGDGLHNLTDGLAIGAAFASAPVTGLATAFAVLCHELPHELGDFALLLQTGVSIRRAVYLNIVSSVLSFVGMAIGLLIAGLHSNMTQWIYAGTAGSFLYIALADLVPAMAAESKDKLKTSLIQVVGVLVGGFIMLAIAINEDRLETLFK